MDFRNFLDPFWGFTHRYTIYVCIYNFGFTLKIVLRIHYPHISWLLFGRKIKKYRDILYKFAKNWSNSSLAVKNCNGEPYNPHCCTSEARCAINQGDCDNDDQCQGKLVCRPNKCPENFPRDADCCALPGWKGEKIKKWKWLL